MFWRRWVVEGGGGRERERGRGEKISSDATSYNSEDLSPKNGQIGSFCEGTTSDWNADWTSLHSQGDRWSHSCRVDGTKLQQSKNGIIQKSGILSGQRCFYFVQHTMFVSLNTHWIELLHHAIYMPINILAWCKRPSNCWRNLTQDLPRRWASSRVPIYSSECFSALPLPAFDSSLPSLTFTHLYCLTYVCINSYLIDQGICYLTLTEKTYPKRLAFLFLEEISRDFESDLKAEHGDEWLRTVETVGRQYAFIKFDRVIQRKRRDYADPNSSVSASVIVSLVVCHTTMIILP